MLGIISEIVIFPGVISHIGIVTGVAGSVLQHQNLPNSHVEIQ